LPQLQQDLGALKSAFDKLPTREALDSVENRLTRIEDRVPSTLPSDIGDIGQALRVIQAEYEAGKRIDEIYKATNKLTTIIAGGRDRGAAGEFILAEVLNDLPPSMLDRDFRVNGKSVEFALVLPNGKRLPIDSKWTASDLVAKLENATDGETRSRLQDALDEAVLKKAAEVAKYRNPAATTDISIAAVPDAAYRACRKAHVRAFQDWNVLIVPYSMAAPYVLAFYNLHLKYGRVIDVANMQAYLDAIEQEVQSIDGDLETRVKEAGTRANNAYERMKTSVGKIRGAIEFLRHAPTQASEGQRPESQGEEPARTDP
jgi:DNA recombination protein RmuC